MNKLLQRQLQKHLGAEKLPPIFLNFLEVINASYDHYEQDRVMLERSIEISSEEMIELNQSQKEAHEELKTLFDNIEEVFFSVRFPDMKLLQMSPACEKVYGRSLEEFQANTVLWYEVILDEDKAVIDVNYPNMFAGNTFINEYRIYHKDGTVRWVVTKIKPTLDREKRLIRIDGITSDITIRKEAELSKAES